MREFDDRSEHFLSDDHFINSHNLSLDSVWILLGENSFWSLLGLEGLTHYKTLSFIMEEIGLQLHQDYNEVMIIFLALGWGSSDKIKLTDVNVITLQQGKMTNSRRTHPVPQLQCVGGTAGCSAFTPRVVQCYNRGSDGYDVQVQSSCSCIIFHTCKPGPCINVR